MSIIKTVDKNIFLFVLSFLFATGFPLQAANQDQKNYAAGEQLELKAGREGSVKVIIKLHVPQINLLTAAANKFRSPDSDSE